MAKQENPKGLIAYFKVGIAIGNQPLEYNYTHIMAPTKEHMDLAVLNYVMKYGLRSIESVTQEEYEKHKTG